MKAIAYLEMKEFDKVVAIGTEVVERFRGTRNISLLYRSSEVLVLKSAAHFSLRDFGTAILNCKELVERFKEFRAPQFQKVVAAALVLQADAETELENFWAAGTLLDEVAERFGDSDAPEVQRSVARALVEKGQNLRIHYNDPQSAISIYDNAISRFGGSDLLEIRQSVVVAWMNRAFACGEIGHFEGEIASYEELITRLDGCNTPGEQSSVVVALGFKAFSLAEMGRAEEALHACDEFVRRFEVATGDYLVETRIWIEWRAKITRALALMVLGRSELAMDMFRSAYAAFLPYHELAIREMLRLVPNLIAAGASEHDLVEILSSDSEKSSALAPLVVALRQRIGEKVRAPAEVLEVAADIHKRIEAKMAKVPS